MKFKKKQILSKPIIFFISILFLQSVNCFSQTKTISQKTIPSFNLKIDSAGAEHPVSSNLFGFSTENLFIEIKNPADTAFTNPLKKINVTVLRWPGGMLSNFHHPTPLLRLQYYYH